jgi:hypothetical protein
MLKATDPEFLRSSSRYRADSFKKSSDKNDKGEHIKFVGIINGNSGQRRAIIRCYDKTIGPGSHCMVSCTCDHFKYKLEVALAARGSAKLENADPKMPVKANPKFLPGLCPHLTYLAKLALAADTTQKAAEQAKTAISDKLKRNR